MSQQKKILFLVRYGPYDLILEELTKYLDVYTFEYSQTVFLTRLKKVKTYSVSYFTFGLSFLIYTLLKKQLSVPVGIKNLTTLLHQIEPNYLVTTDFFHWSFLQAVNYKKRHREVNLFLLSETKAFPSNKISKIVFRFFLSFLKKNSQYLDAIIVPTKQAQVFYNQLLPEAKVILIPAPIDVKLFRPFSNKNWLPDDTLRILVNARYVPYKRHEDVLRAALLLLKNNQKFSVTFIGRGGENKKALQKRIIDLGLSKHVVFIQSVASTQMPEIYSSYDILVLPSRNEAIGLVVPEAMACGLPTISSDTVGANVYVQNNQTGYIYKTGDYNELFLCLTNLYAPGVLARFSDAAIERIQFFTKEKCTQELLKQIQV